MDELTPALLARLRATGLELVLAGPTAVQRSELGRVRPGADFIPYELLDELASDDSERVPFGRGFYYRSWTAVELRFTLDDEVGAFRFLTLENELARDVILRVEPSLAGLVDGGIARARLWREDVRFTAKHGARAGQRVEYERLRLTMLATREPSTRRDGRRS